jgi:hypothetical protein
VSDSSLDLSYNLKVCFPGELFREVEMNFLEFLLNKHLIREILNVLEDVSHFVV